jgi:hypothetical protein
VLLPDCACGRWGDTSALVIDDLHIFERTGMSDGDRAPVLKLFVDELNMIWREAGPPSFAEVEAMSRKFTRPIQPSGLRVLVLAHATTQGILAGRRRTLPKWL